MSKLNNRVYVGARYVPTLRMMEGRWLIMPRYVGNRCIPRPMGNWNKNKKCYVYNNGCEYKIDWNNLESEGWGNLSISEIRLGNPWGIDNCGYISDVKIFNRAMSSDEVLEMYRGN